MRKPLVLDGRTGEGGGQLVRIACGLAALTSQPVTINNVRGNRQGGRGGGLKAQHVTSLSWLAKVTDADVDGLSVGSKNLTFSPRLSPTSLPQRSVRIEADTDAASALLILQAILPYVLFASNENNEPIMLDILGGTNVHWSPSYEYLDQVFIPTLEERFGIQIDSELRTRGWSLGPPSRGHVWLKICPVPLGEKLRFTPPQPPHVYPDSLHVERIDASIVVPIFYHDMVQKNLSKDLGELYPGAEIQFKVVQDSGHDTRWSLLLVAHSTGRIRWARDKLFSLPKKMNSGQDRFIKNACLKLCKDLFEETSLGGTVDEYLQDQLVPIQALAEGFSSFPRGDGPATLPLLDSCHNSMDKLGDQAEVRMRREKTHDPFGNGSMHTTTARWVASQLLPRAEFYNKGDIVKGIGFSL